MMCLRRKFERSNFPTFVSMNDIQDLLIEQLKRKLEKGETLAQLLSDTLHISSDAAYRRLRGETLFSIQETKKLCDSFEISFDALSAIREGHVVFRHQPLNTIDFSLESYLQGILDAFIKLDKMGGAEIFLSVNNLNFLQLMNFPQLVRFKLYFWAKTHLQIPKYKDEKFVHKKTTDSAFALGKEILRLYCKIPSKEIYDPEFMRGFMRQIHYYFKARLFEEPEYALFLHDRISMLSQHLNEQAQAGKKFIYGTKPPETGNEFEMFYNETINSDGSFYYQSNEQKGLFVTHNIMSYLETDNPNYTRDSKLIIDRQMANSSQISLINERERNNFFYEFDRTNQRFKKRITAELEF